MVLIFSSNTKHWFVFGNGWVRFLLDNDTLFSSEAFWLLLKLTRRLLLAVWPQPFKVYVTSQCCYYVSFLTPPHDKHLIQQTSNHDLFCICFNSRITWSPTVPPCTSSVLKVCIFKAAAMKTFSSYSFSSFVDCKPQHPRNHFIYCD